MSTITLTRGDAQAVPATVDVTDILPDVLSKAWFTVKRRRVDTDEQAVIQKTITSSLTDQGQIDNVGATDVDGSLFFLLTPDDSNALDANILYYYDIKVLSSGGAPKILESGRVQAFESVTRVGA